MIGQLKADEVKLRRIFIEYKLPKELQPLNELANNLWWSWNKEATELFRRIDPRHWEKYAYNPIALLDHLSVERTQELMADKAFMEQLDRVCRRYQEYMKAPRVKGTPRIAYFSMEFGLHISVRLYSGGLGVLAGDFLKEASDRNADMVGVGLLYRYGYFQQAISLNGDQINNFPPQDFTLLPVVPARDRSGEWVKVSINFPGRVVHAKLWELKVGRISLYLLDTDLDENQWEDRSLTHQLYGGENEHRLKQEILLGVGGMRAVEALGIDADVYHCNEGHAAFMGLERLRHHIQDDQLTYDQALEVVRSSGLFTTHTPVPAGHDYFSEDLLRLYLGDYIQSLGIPWSVFIGLGRINPSDSAEPFSMSHLAIRLSEGVNGVSQLHGLVSQRMFKVLYPGYSAEEVPIGFVTNSVHYPTWVAAEWNQLYVKYFGEKFLSDQSNKEYWRKIYEVPADEIVAIRQQLKKRLLDFVRASLQKDLMRRGEQPSAIFEVLNNIREDALVLGFARRFATYKRAHLLFTNLERLAEIVNDEKHPVMFIFAGKAHPADWGGQDLIKHIIQVSKRPEFAGKVVFLENYNIEMAKHLVSGVDVWLNTPTRPKEASGTSGMKAVMNGVLNFSVLDGWWAEGFRSEAGWALPLERTYDDQRLQDELDAETIYNILENEIVPGFFDRNDQGYSDRWIGYVRNVIAEIAPVYTMKRMMDDYYRRFYEPLTKRGRKIREKNFAKAIQISDWKEQLRAHWDKIQLVDMDIFDSDNFSLRVGDTFKGNIRLQLDGIDPEDVGLEAVFYRRTDDDQLELQVCKELKLLKKEGEVATYAVDINPQISGVYEYGFRLFPKHPLLPYKQDLELVRWL